MAWYTVNYKCGHTGEVQIYGKESERLGKAKWIGEHSMCPECEDAAKRDKAARAREAGEITEGTYKQIAWASDIREGMLRAIDEAEVAPGKAERVRGLVRDWASSHTDARWYIDHREQLKSLRSVSLLIPADVQREMMAEE